MVGRDLRIAPVEVRFPCGRLGEPAQPGLRLVGTLGPPILTSHFWILAPVSCLWRFLRLAGNNSESFRERVDSCSNSHEVAVLNLMVNDL
jgi:hypothetical protein